MVDASNSHKCPGCDRGMKQVYNGALVNLSQTIDPATRRAGVSLKVSVLLSCSFCKTDYHHDFEVPLPIS